MSLFDLTSVYKHERETKACQRGAYEACPYEVLWVQRGVEVGGREERRAKESRENACS